MTLVNLYPLALFSCGFNCISLHTCSHLFWCILMRNSFHNGHHSCGSIILTFHLLADIQIPPISRALIQYFWMATEWKHHIYISLPNLLGGGYIVCSYISKWEMNLLKASFFEAYLMSIFDLIRYHLVDLCLPKVANVYFADLKRIIKFSLHIFLGIL